MYNILVVDDERLICRGLAGLLRASGLGLGQIMTAASGEEALDYIRLEDVDLLITDIQMGEISGIELMHQAKMAKPWVQAIIISAHETFQYAQTAIRLGAKDYLIKPLNSEQFLDSVRSVLLKMDKPLPRTEEVLSAGHEDFRMEEPGPAYSEPLNQLLEEPVDRLDEPHPKTAYYEHLGLKGPYFSVIKIRLALSEAEDARYSEQDARLLQYAALNIVKELLDQQWHADVFYGRNRNIHVIVQWSEEEYAELQAGRIHQLEMIGRSMHHHIVKYLKIPCTVGISQILKGLSFLNVLSRQADKAMLWSREHKDYHVFYYGDFSWHNYERDPDADELSTQSNQIVEQVKRYIDEHYHQKGLTIHEVAKRNHVSPNYLSYLFKKITGSNLWEYVVKLRMEESRSLLLHTDLRRYEIAERVGYESPEHFSKIFKKYYGVSPSDLKK